MIQEFQLIVIPLDNNNLQWELSQCYYKKNRDFRGIEQFYQAWRKSYSSFFDTKFFENFLRNGASAAAAKNQPAQWQGTAQNCPSNQGKNIKLILVRP